MATDKGKGAGRGRGTGKGRGKGDNNNGPGDEHREPYKEAPWPTLDEQLRASKVRPGTALDKLVRENQDFEMLRPEEAHDRLGLPPWLRVHWRKHHPDGNYSGDDPTGGYPLGLKDLYRWMIEFQDFPVEKGPQSESGGGDGH
jgi:hypothetical protein